MVSIAKSLLPQYQSNQAIELLRQNLNEDTCSFFKPALSDEVQIMTIHKSKGLEFDVVFHLDLYEWILPAKRIGEEGGWDNQFYPSKEQDINLHYVGISRAKQACFLCSSTKRINANQEEKNGMSSEFLAATHEYEYLRNYRKSSPI